MNDIFIIKSVTLNEKMIKSYKKKLKYILRFLQSDDKTFSTHSFHLGMPIGGGDRQIVEITTRGMGSDLYHCRRIDLKKTTGHRALKFREFPKFFDTLFLPFLGAMH